MSDSFFSDTAFILLLGKGIFCLSQHEIQIFVLFLIYSYDLVLICVLSSL